MAAEAERSEAKAAGWGIAQRLVDQRQYAVEIAIDVVVPEAQHREAPAQEMPVALGVTPCMRSEIMLTAVDFDDEAVL